MVFFSDKDFTEYSIEEPEQFLSQRAIERRLRHGIEITEHDLPVSQVYIDSLKLFDIRPYYSTKWMNAVLVEAEGSVLEDMLQFQFFSSYEYVAPGVQLSSSPDRYELVYNGDEPSKISSNSMHQLQMLGADDMHSDGFTGEGVLMAVLDAGFQFVNTTSVFRHVFENERLLDHFDFTTNEHNVFVHDTHGTNALSCIAAKYESTLVGTGYDASFVLYITEDKSSEYRIEEYNWLFGAERADQLGVDIISSSVGYSTFQDPEMDYVYTQHADGKSSVVSKAAQWATDKGILVVNSAGNEGQNKQWPYLVFPSDVDGVIAVAATDGGGGRTSFSSIGPTSDGRIKPDVAALGSHVALYSQDGVIATRSGTSFSAPLVAGLAAGLWQKFPELTNLELKELILGSGEQHFSPDTLLGHGVPNYNYTGTSRVLSLGHLMADNFTVFPNPFSEEVISVDVDRSFAGEPLDFKLYAPDGKEAGQLFVKKHRKDEVYNINVVSGGKGIYVLRIFANGLTKNVKLLRY